MPLTATEVGTRECFEPRPGYIYIDADIDQLEMCTLAQAEIWTLGDRTKADQINNEIDLHCVTGGFIARVPYEVVLAGKGGEYKSVRNLAKVPNFGKPGGMADETLIGFARSSYGIKLAATAEDPRPCREAQVAEARRIGRAWRAANPADVAYLEYIRTLRQRGGGKRYNVTIGHPSIGVYFHRGQATYCAAANSLFQGLGALAAGEITWLVQQACYWEEQSPLFGCRLVVHAYDEWLLECPIGRQTEAGDELVRLIKVGMNHMVPDLAARTEAVAMAIWTKAAKRVVRDGELLIWGTEECSDYVEQQKKEAA